ncbi:hypothetical protein GCM10023100_15420 [Actinocorallia cavernae]|uniref:Uncharacterized protein n=2 Tax=Actinomycetes TaxID=1760 RepID=A0ABP8SER0_9ACTN
MATTAVIPFVQNIASQAVGDVYAKAKQLFGRALRRSSQKLELRGRPSGDALRRLGEAESCPARPRRTSRRRAAGTGPRPGG